MTPYQVRCPSCEAAPSQPCQLPSGQKAVVTHAARFRYARALTEGTKTGDILYVDRKFRLQADGTWRNRAGGAELAIKDGTRVDFDVVAGMWRPKDDGPLTLHTRPSVRVDVNARQGRLE